MISNFLQNLFGGLASNAGTAGKWAGIAQGVESIASVVSGISSMRASNAEAQAIQQQSIIQQHEAALASFQKRREILRAQATQASLYGSSGVTMEGTPMVLLEETQNLGQQELNMMASQSKAYQNLYTAKSKQYKSSGRNALFGSFLGGALGGVSTYATGLRMGLYGSKVKAPTLPIAPTP
jgi:hypothetical protein